MASGSASKNPVTPPPVPWLKNGVSLDASQLPLENTEIEKISKVSPRNRVSTVVAFPVIRKRTAFSTPLKRTAVMPRGEPARIPLWEMQQRGKYQYK